MENYEKIQGLNGYRWKPNASQKAEYKARMQEKESLPTFTTSHAIRNGCIVEFYSVSKGKKIKGEVVKNTYGAKTNQHTFTIQENDGTKHLVKGRNLYPNIISHVQGNESKNLNKSLNKPNTMTTTKKKPTAKRKPSVRTLKSVCSKLAPEYGKKVDGTLKKGFRYKDGKVVKAAAKKRATKKTTTTTKRKTTTKKKSGLLGLGFLGIL